MVDEPLLEDADEPPVAIQKMSWMSLADEPRRVLEESAIVAKNWTMQRDEKKIKTNQMKACASHRSIGAVATGHKVAFHQAIILPY